MISVVQLHFETEQQVHWSSKWNQKPVEEFCFLLWIKEGKDEEAEGKKKGLKINQWLKTKKK